MSRNINYNHILYFLILIFIITFIGFNKKITLGLNTDADLYKFNQLFWNTINGRPFLVQYYGSYNEFNYLGNHMSLSMMLIVPFYWLYPDPITLLSLQVVFIGLSAIPLYWIAKNKLNNEIAALIIVASFLLNPYVGHNTLKMFHGALFVMLFLFLSWYFIEKNDYKKAFLSLAIAVLSREDIALTGIIFGVYIFFFKNKKKIGFGMSFLNSLYLVLVIKFIQPYLLSLYDLSLFGAGNANFEFYSNFYSHLGNNYYDILTNIILHPGNSVFSPSNIMYLFKLLFPMGFLPLLSPFILLIPSLNILENSLGNYDFMRNPAIRYSIVVFPFLYISSIYSIKLISQRMNRRDAVYLLPILMVICSLFTSIYFWKNFDWERHEISEHTLEAREIVKNIPKNASVAAQIQLLSLVSDRRKIAEVNRVWPLYGFDYIILDEKSKWYWIYNRPGSNEAKFRTYIQKLKLGNHYELINEKDGYLIFKENKSSNTYLAEDPSYQWIEAESKNVKIIKRDVYPVNQKHNNSSGGNVVVFKNNDLNVGNKYILNFSLSVDSNYTIWVRYKTNIQSKYKTGLSVYLDNNLLTNISSKSKNEFIWEKLYFGDLKSGVYSITVEQGNVLDAPNYLWFDVFLIAQNNTFIPTHNLSLGAYSLSTLKEYSIPRN